MKYSSRLSWPLAQLGILALIALMGLPAEARRFRNAYVSFELPERWNCSMENTEWVCVNNEQKPKEAVIILTAKELGPGDSLENYENHLKSVRNLARPDGSTQASQVVQVNRVNIDNHTWVDGLQIGSEINSYYTRYLITTKDRIAILVTFSAHRNFYTRYSPDFLRAINSLRVVATQDLLRQGGAHGVRGAHESLGTPVGTILSGDLDLYMDEEEGGSGGSSALTWLALGVIILSAGLLLLRKKPQPKKKRRPKSKPS